MNTILTEEMQQRFTAEQLSMSERITLTDSRDFSSLQTVAGVDLAYWNTDDGREHAVCCIVVLDAKTHAVLETVSADGEITVPYCPGFLAFRELPLVQEAIAEPSEFAVRPVIGSRPEDSSVSQSGVLSQSLEGRS